MLKTVQNTAKYVTILCLLFNLALAHAAVSQTLNNKKVLTNSTPQASLIVGWNLLGNSVNAPISVATAFPIGTTNVSTVWKWETSGPTLSGITYPVWAFYTPTQSDGGKAYAASKGYDFLTTINAGEGFWVNATSSFTLPLPAGTAIASTTFADQVTGINNLPAGWSLLATGDNPTPKFFANTISLNPPAIGAANSLTTLWAWDSIHTNWYFYAPGLDNAGTLTSYISNKSYLDFAGSATSAAKTLDPTTGFWVNHSSASVTSMISTSGNVFCALNTNSQMYCWGAGANGLIGSNVVCRGPGYCSSLQSFPIAVTSSSGTGNLSGVRQIANDYFNTCALMQTGIVRCWGENNFGEMGNGTTQPWYNVYPSDTVVDINGTGSLSQVRSIAAGGFSSCAALASGALACWGMEQGSSPPNYTATPILIAGIDNVGTLSGVSAVSVGLQSSCALLTGGAVACWGDNSAGELGSILITNDKGPTSTYPQLVSGTGSNGTVITSVAVGAWHACALTQTGGVMCWGWNMSGQLGIGLDPVVQEFAYAPTPVLGSSGNGALTGIVAVTSGDFHSCALTSAGTVYCWGGNTFGQLGNNSSAASENLPVQVTGVGGVNFLTGVTQITAGGSSTCALLSSGNMVCWGQGAALGDPNNSSSTPVYQVDTSGTGMLNLGH